VLASFLALQDPDAALTHWSKQGSVEFGESRSYTLYWMFSLKEMGSPDLGVSPDTPLYSAFKRASGERTYLVYNTHDTTLHVTFSSGQVLDVPARSLARLRGASVAMMPARGAL